LVLGTDAAPYGFPGLSTRQELQELVAAGFSPYQALLTTTRNAGNFIAENLPNAPRFGTISEGNEADLLLLSANPLRDIRNAEKIDGVMLQGHWIPYSTLNSLQSAIQAHAAPIKRRLVEIDAAPEAGDIARAQKIAAPLQSETSPWVAECVLTTKARKLQSTKLPAATEIARWNTLLYPDSFSAQCLLADLLFQDKKLSEAMVAAKKSQTLEPHNAVNVNLLEKLPRCNNRYASLRREPTKSSSKTINQAKCKLWTCPSRRIPADNSAARKSIRPANRTPYLPSLLAAIAFGL